VPGFIWNGAWSVVMVRMRYESRSASVGDGKALDEKRRQAFPTSSSPPVLPSRLQLKTCQD
jgi:hypothetical protein